ncbi:MULTISPECIES: GAF domain-containing protein [unclassified Bradyrhizobium]|uniref:GAF domain-containing sensor histidine kinase n=1 Tax=unclassified Bradyrhizobium TaxID=2631580 RepID=UPI001FFADCE3|nr:MULTISPECIES: GAF domain-containing protein [unclassified Bradyrhizobium]MCK1305852.1 GAF domain-containing protein [Bradyrhizobium sp. 45]MCK1433841.1 GAF domain-containing protein [Bradyrhizobium sp. 15]MCK1611501.1 GAF domain-containing protein [Bradyrhizobium sp. 163]MCK1764013.1 GAF domain-containing protein [Bradyrhizobium sp. 136]
MTAPPLDAVADLHKLIADLEQRLASSFAAHDAATARAAATDAENGRLREELANLRERQNASAHILRTIASASGDAESGLQQIAEATARLFHGASVAIRIAAGNEWGLSVSFGAGIERITALVPEEQRRPGGRNLPAVVFRENRQIHIPDIDNIDADMADWPVTLARTVGIRTVAGTPLRRDGKAIGALIVQRDRLKPFTADELVLQQSFADQAVIAIENARLFNKTKEALERQTATAEVLEVISSSPGDLKPVFEQMLAKAMSLCEADCGFIYQMEQGAMRAVVEAGVPAAFAEYRRQNLHTGGAATPADVMRTTRKPAHVHNAQESEAYRSGNPNAVAGVDLGGARTVLYVPMIKNEDIVGVINVYRQEVRPFTEEQISLLENFASQAVVAIENARLFNETRQALEQQTATSEVLSIISRSGGDLGPVFDAILGKAMQLCDANFGVLNTYDGHRFHTAATFGLPPAYDEYRRKQPLDYGPDTAPARLLKGERSVAIADLAKSKAYLDGERNRRALVELGGAQCVLAVPLLKGGGVVGNVMIFRQENRPFTEKQTALLEQFAAQAVIAIENTRLLSELRQRTADLSRSLDELRTAQDRLVQTEKLASLGQLTAGIAHEIKNPLNFVNNFAALSAELTAELKETLAPAPLDHKMRSEVDELSLMLKSNLEKVVQHGKRADTIVKNMLLHSREGSGEHRAADINALVDESLNLACHGARAEKPQFNVTVQRDFDPRAGLVEVFPQEITRVLLNLISNGLHAVASRVASNSSADFEPLITARTRASEDQVEIRIRDNGTGIPPEVKEKIFNPFFTTKPAGEGTGLGLSIAHDIIVKQHGGRIEVTSEPQQFTEFVVFLPRHGSNSRSGGES